MLRPAEPCGPGPLCCGLEARPPLLHLQSLQSAPQAFAVAWAFLGLHFPLLGRLHVRSAQSGPGSHFMIRSPPSLSDVSVRWDSPSVITLSSVDQEPETLLEAAGGPSEHPWGPRGLR